MWYMVFNQRGKVNFSKGYQGFFYWLLDSIADIEYPANTLTARLLKRKYVDSVLSFRDRAFDVWALFNLAGCNQKSIMVPKASKGTSIYFDSQKLSGNGEYTKRGQQFIERKLGIKKCLLTTSATDALEMIAILLNIMPGD